MRFEKLEAAIISLIALLPASKRTIINRTCSVTKPARSDEPGMLGRETTHPFHTRPFYGGHKRWAQVARTEMSTKDSLSAIHPTIS